MADGRMRTASAGIAALALVFGAVACGGDGDGGTLTIEEYFAEVKELDVELQEATDELEPAIDQLSPDDVEGARELYAQVLNALDAFLDGMSGLNPPDEAVEVHDETLDLFKEARGAFSGALDESEDAETFLEIFDDSDRKKIRQAIGKCAELEQVAADNDIEVDLNCGEE